MAVRNSQILPSNIARVLSILRAAFSISTMAARAGLELGGNLQVSHLAFDFFSCAICSLKVDFSATRFLRSQLGRVKCRRVERKQQTQPERTPPEGWHGKVRSLQGHFFPSLDQNHCRLSAALTEEAAIICSILFMRAPVDPRP